MSFKLNPTLEADSYVLGTFPLSLLLLINDSQYPWFTLVPQRSNISEIYELSETEQTQLWLESRQLSIAVMQVHKGDKLNVAAIGNMVNQLHLHHVVRFKTDKCWPKPIWGQLPMKPYILPEVNKLKTQLIMGLKHTQFEPSTDS